MILTREITIIPDKIEKIQHHLGKGVRPFAKAMICVIAAVRKNGKNTVITGSRKHPVNLKVPSMAIDGAAAYKAFR